MFRVGAIALLFEGDIDIFHFIFFVLFALIFAKLFYSHIHQKIEYAYYGTVTKKEVRYGISDRFTPTVTDYSKTIPQKTKENNVEYDFISVMIDGIEIDNICCHHSLSRKIEVGSDVIIAKGYNVYDEPTVYRK